MTYEVATVVCGGPGPKIPGGPRIRTFDNGDNKFTPCQAYHHILYTSTKDVIIYVHDDVTIHDGGWVDQIMRVFEADSNVVAVGLGGALALGNHDLSRKPFNIWNMARRGYASNQTDAETHGERFTGVRRVAVLDAFVMAVRVDWLRLRRTPQYRHIADLPKVWNVVYEGGWPTARLTHHCLDTWLACEAARDGKEIWMVGANCTHHGGGSSTKPEYRNAGWLFGGTMEMDHQAPHIWIANEYRDVLPIEVSA